MGGTEAGQSGSDLNQITLGVVGAGVMAEAMIAGLLRRGLLLPERVVCSHLRAERAQELEARCRVTVVADNAEVARRADIMVLAVKHQVLPSVLGDVGGSVGSEVLVMSIVAGASTAAISSRLGHAAIIRVMPNTPAQIGAGFSVWFATPEVSPASKSKARALLSALGSELEVEDEGRVTMRRGRF